MRINPAALAKSIGSLDTLDGEFNLEQSLQAAVLAAKSLFKADGAGLMLADSEGRLRWASATDRRAEIAEDSQEVLAQGPCQTAFTQVAPAVMRDARLEPHWGEMTLILAEEAEIRAALSVPVEARGGPIGTLDVYSAAPRDWDASEISAVQAYAGIVASLLVSAIDAHAKGRLAEQLQTALDHRVLIEQAKGVLMERDGLDAPAAFERIRTSARSSRRSAADIARELLASVPRRTRQQRQA
jgi:GAF domain-containing protein